MKTDTQGLFRKRDIRVPACVYSKTFRYYTANSQSKINTSSYGENLVNFSRLALECQMSKLLVV